MKVLISFVYKQIPGIYHKVRDLESFACKEKKTALKKIYLKIDYRTSLKIQDIIIKLLNL